MVLENILYGIIGIEIYYGFPYVASVSKLVSWKRSKPEIPKNLTIPSDANALEFLVLANSLERSQATRHREADVVHRDTFALYQKLIEHYARKDLSKDVRMYEGREFYIGFYRRGWMDVGINTEVKVDGKWATYSSYWGIPKFESSEQVREYAQSLVDKRFNGDSHKQLYVTAIKKYAIRYSGIPIPIPTPRLLLGGIFTRFNFLSKFI